ncbi:MAG: tRNA (5-methylaminomethyl-2-thiouridine)(34)-methyltransferase MnmD [Candidatus Omnitrophota bacterium]
MKPDECVPPVISWDGQGAPYAEAFGDKYFCTEDGYAEAVHVGCGGNRLRERFTALNAAASGVFTIVETGFGTGLDFSCAWELWRECAPVSWQLHFVSLELYPLTPDQLDRALSCWDNLSFAREALAAQYNPVPGRVMTNIFESGRVRLTVVFDDVVTALKRIKTEAIVPQGADAFYLDGFAPSLNPAMWADDVFKGVAALSRPGTTFSTFTVAGFVRRGLQLSGFDVEKIPGHGRKKHILTGVFSQREYKFPLTKRDLSA